MERVRTDCGVTIGSRRVGPDQPVYIIAEAGVNHDGDVKLAFQLIEAAREAGADAVKFQVFSAERLAAEDAPSCSYQHATESQRAMLHRLELDEPTFRDLKCRAEHAGLEFLATPFGLPELQFLVDLGLPAIKIASPDVVNVPLLRAAAGSGRTLIVSTGAAEQAEIDAAVALVSAMPPAGRLVLLHCVSAYPTPPAEARLACIGTMSRRYGVPVGFSDHTSEIHFGGLAVAAGAVMLEKHLTLDRRLAGPDHFFSLEPSAFADYVRIARGASAALGDGRIRVSQLEREVREKARGSIVAVQSIPAGARLQAAMLAVQRPGGGLSASVWDQVIGREAAVDISAGTRLAWSMLHPARS